MAYNPFTQEEETTCHRCGEETPDLCPFWYREDGSLCERTDGSFGKDDIFLCQGCILD